MSAIVYYLLFFISYLNKILEEKLNKIKKK